MSVRSLNKVMLIGNLTRDPELRYTPGGTAVCTFGLATNRSWTMQTGETREETEFHRIVSWNKLGELCSQLLSKGRKVFVEGRLTSRTWTGQDGQQRTTVEIVIDDMIILDSRKFAKDGEGGVDAHPDSEVTTSEPSSQAGETQEGDASGKTSPKQAVKTKKKEQEQPAGTSEEISPDDIPF